MHTKHLTVRNRGIALLIAVIFMSVMLALGIALSSLGYKQQLLVSSALDSQYAFYAADTALECVLYADQQLNAFKITDPQASFDCDGQSVQIPAPSNTGKYNAFLRMQIRLDNNTQCAEVAVYKAKNPSNDQTYLFSQGYNIPCEKVNDPSKVARFASRGLQAHY